LSLTLNGVPYRRDFLPLFQFGALFTARERTTFAARGSQRLPEIGAVLSMKILDDGVSDSTMV